MVADDIIQLAMRQHARFRAASGAGRVEKPRRMIAIDIRRPCDAISAGGEPFPVLSDRELQPAVGVFRFCRRRMLGERVVEDVHGRAGGCREIRNLRRCQAEVCRHPDRAQHPGREHRFQHRVGVARMQQNPVAMPHTTRRQTPRRGLDPGVELSPCPGRIAPDQRGPAGKPPRRLDQEVRQIGGGDQRNGSRIET